MNELLLSELFETAKAEGIHFASLLLAKLAGHISDETLTSQGGNTCPPGTYWDATSKSCIKDVG